MTIIVYIKTCILKLCCCIAVRVHVSLSVSHICGFIIIIIIISLTWTKLLSPRWYEKQIVCEQGRNHVFKVGGSIPRSRVLLPFYENNQTGLYPVWCSRLHNHTLFIKKPCKKLGVRPNFGKVQTPLDTPVVAPMFVNQMTMSG